MGDAARTPMPTATCGPSRGSGLWTSAEVRARAFGDADAISFGDYHVAKDVCCALTGRPADDATMAEPGGARTARHRLRVQMLVGAGRAGPTPAGSADDPARPHAGLTVSVGDLRPSCDHNFLHGDCRSAVPRSTCG